MEEKFEYTNGSISRRRTDNTMTKTKTSLTTTGYCCVPLGGICKNIHILLFICFIIIFNIIVRIPMYVK